MTASSRNDNDDIQHICYHGRVCFRFSFLYTYIFIYKSLSLSLWSINLFCPLVFNLAKDFYYFFITGLLRGNMYVSVSLSLSLLFDLFSSFFVLLATLMLPDSSIDLLLTSASFNFSEHALIFIPSHASALLYAFCVEHRRTKVFWVFFIEANVAV